MQSCQSKNVHTGTGPTKAKGPVSASNGMAESLPKTSSHLNGSAQPTISCKVENNLSPNVVIKPENDKLNDGSVNQNRSKSHELYDNMIHSHAPSMTYSMNAKVLDTPDLSPSPSRGSIGVQQIPTVQHDTAVQPTENNLNSDNAILSHRKQARIGKSMERDRQLQQQNHSAVPSGYHNHHHHHHHHHHHINHQQTMINNDASALVEMPQFKQEFSVKKERDVKKEKDCDEIVMTNFSHSSAANIKVERPENENHRQESSSLSKSTTNNNRIETPPIVQNEISSENDTVTVNLINESSDECGIDYSIKRKHIENDDVIELSDNSTVDPSSMPVKRRKLLEKPISTPKKSPPNSYKSLIKQSNSTTASSTTATANEEETAPEITIVPDTTTLLKTPTEVATKPKLISSNINRILNKSTMKRRNILKSKSTFKTMRFTVKAKRRAMLKKKQLQRKKSMTINEKSQQEKTSDKLTSSINDDDEIIETDKNHSTSTNNCKISGTTQLIEDDNDNSSSETTIEEEKSLDICEQVSNEMSEHNEDRSMDGSSEYSGKSNIDLTIDRVAKGYFSESEIFSSLSKHRKTKGQKRFEAKLLDLCTTEKKKRTKEKVQNNNISNSSGKDKSLNVPEKDKEKEKDREKEKPKKKNTKVNKATPQQTENTTDVVVIKSPAQSTITEGTVIQPNNNKNKNNNNDTCNKKTTTKKPKKTKAKEPKEVDNKEPIKEKMKKTAPKKKTKETSNNDSTEKESLKVNTEETPSSHATPKRKQKVVTSKKGCTAKKAKTTDVNEKVIIEPSTNDNDDDVVNDDKTTEVKDAPSTTSALISSTPTTVMSTKPLVIDETDVANNNNECFENNNNKLKHQEPLTLYKTPGFGWTTALVKASRRGKKPKYTNRKKVKLTLPNDIVIPKSTSIPRWSNGWVWEGEPYQALVFLNVSILLNIHYQNIFYLQNDIFRVMIRLFHERATIQCVTRNAVM